MKYLKFLLILTFKKWQIIVSILLYLLTFSVFLYVLPLFLNKEYLTIFGIKIFISISTLFLVIFSAFIVSVIFLNPLEMGYEILILTKPIKKTNLFIIKISILLMMILLMSLLSLIVSMLVKFEIYDYYESSSAIWLSSFIGTLINCLFWCSLTLLLGLWINKNRAIICAFAIKAIMLFVSFTCLFTNISLSHIQNQKQVIAKSVGLVSNIDKNNEISYQWGAISVNHNWKPIDINSKMVGNNALKFQIKNLNEFNNFYWNQVNKETNSEFMNAIDLDYQLSSLYTYYSNNQLKNFNPSLILNLLMYEEMLSRNFIPSFTTIDFHNIENQFDIAKLKIMDDLFYLTLNPNLLIEWNSGKNRIGSNLFFGHVKSSFKIDWDLNSLLLPILEIDENEQNWKLQEFKDIQSFAKYYYSNSFDLNKHEFEVYLNQKTLGEYKNWSFSVYWTMLSSYLAQVKNVNLKSSDFEIRNWLNDLYKLVFNFQYWTYLFIKDAVNQPQEYKWLDFLGFQTALANLNYFTYVHDREITSKFTWLTYMDKASDLFKSIKQNDLIIDKNSAFKSLLTPFSLMPKRALDTFSLVNLKPTINSNNVLISWILASMFMNLLSIFIYTKKDVK